MGRLIMDLIHRFKKQIPMIIKMVVGVLLLMMAIIGFVVGCIAPVALQPFIAFVIIIQFIFGIVIAGSACNDLWDELIFWSKH